MKYDDIDIFEAGREMQRGSYSPPEGLDLTPAQSTYLAGALVDPYGAADFTGNYFEFPTSDMSIKDMATGPRAPSFIENLKQGNLGDATFQGIGALPVPLLAGAMKYIKAASKLGEAADPRILRATEQGYDFDNVMYHASKQDIDEFVPGYDDGLTFLTPSKEFASNWLGKGKFQERQGGTGSIEGVKEKRKQLNIEGNKILESLPESERQKYYEEVLLPQDQQLLKDERLADSAIYPVVTKTKKPFVPHKDFKVLDELYGKEYMDVPFSSDMPTHRDAYKAGNYLLYEKKEVVDFLKSKGYDSMFLKENTFSKADVDSEDYSTFAVFEPKDIRSVNAEFDPDAVDSPILLKNKGGPVNEEEDIIDIFESGMSPLPEPLLTPAQASWFLSQLPPGSGLLDVSRGTPAMPSSDAAPSEFYSGELQGTLAENLARGNNLEAALQSLGGLGDLAYGIPALGMVAGPALKGLSAAGRAGLKSLRAADEPVKAFHSSPHDFNKFVLEKIGTGEGAQAYGWGLYFAENPEVAKYYREAFEEGSGGLHINDKKLDEVYNVDIRNKFPELYSDLMEEGAERIRFEKDDMLDQYLDSGTDLYDEASDIIDRLVQENMKDTPNFELVAKLQDKLRIGTGLPIDEIERISDLAEEAFLDTADMDTILGNLSQIQDDSQLDIVMDYLNPKQKEMFNERLAPKIEMKGGEAKTYEVDLKVNKDKLLDWDEPLMNQPEVLKKIESLFEEKHGDPEIVLDRLGLLDENKDFKVSVTGGEFYEKIAGIMDSAGRYNYGASPEKAKAVSEMLRDEAGIDGIKYADGFTRRKDGSSKNFVIFDPRLIQITKQYGIPIGVGAAFLAKMDQAKEELSTDNIDVFDPS